ncbi:MAG: MaoC family dehydratase [Burkholderiales bacterium]
MPGGRRAYAGRFFEDFRLAQKIRHATPRTLTDGDCALYIALTGARHVHHSARPAAWALGYRDRPVDDLLVFNMAFGKTVHDVSLNAIASLGYADARFRSPCYAGDTLRAESEVIGLKQNSSGRSGVVYVRSSAFNQDGELILTWVRWVMLPRKNLEAPAPATVIPELPESVAVERLSVPSFLDASKFDTSATGGTALWEDYRPGERVDHASGMTIEESDHMLATRLYQNTARLHFDALATRDSRFGRRLVYGGHVISVCRALSYEGLENALSIAAINSGSHVGPVVAGDTLYATSEIVEKWPLPGRTDLGALRLRLIGLKNLPAARLASYQDRGGAYDPHVVLALDYTVLMPRRTGR